MKTLTLYWLPAERFIEMFYPGDFDFTGIEDNQEAWKEALLELDDIEYQNSRRHWATSDYLALLVDIDKNGISEPVEVSFLRMRLTDGHHRTWAALRTQRDVPFVAYDEGNPGVLVPSSLSSSCPETANPQSGLSGWVGGCQRKADIG